MAKMLLGNIDNYRAALTSLGDKSLGIIKQGVYDGAAIVIDKVKENLAGVVPNGTSSDLYKSIGLAKMQDDDGYVYTRLTFADYDSEGHPNIVKARMLESGSSNRDYPKRPFIRPALTSSKAAAVAAMSATINDSIKKTMEE